MTIEAELPLTEEIRGGWRVFDLIPHLNNRGITNANEKDAGGFNIWGNSLPAEDLPKIGDPFKFLGVPFRLQRRLDSGADNLVCIGQNLVFPAILPRTLHLIAASERCSRGEFIPLWEDRKLSPLELVVSDFWPGAPANSGNDLFVRCQSLHYPRHIQRNMNPALWHISQPLARQRLDGLILPDNPAIHIFAITVEEAV